nr:DUF6348 family protein [uncultured Clostridium sp.]
MGFLKKFFNGKDNAKSQEEMADDIIIQILKEEGMLKNIHSEIINNELVINDLKMTIKARVSNKTQHQNAIVLQLDFIIKHENFDTEILESAAGIGRENDIYDAIRNGTASFVSNVIEVIADAFCDTHNPELDFQTVLGDRQHIWHPKIGGLHAQGYCDKNTIDNNRIFNILKDEIVPRLGTKRFYWIKVYVSRQADGEIITQCTFNNEPFLKAQQKMEEYAKSWNTGNQFKGEKQFILIRQCDKTWKQGKYNYENLKMYVFGAMELFENCSTEADWEGLFVRIADLTGDIDLAIELYFFIPELYCKLTLPEIQYSDEVVLIKPDGSEINVYLSQLSRLTLIKRLVREKLHSGFDKDKYNHVLFQSATFRAINSALNQGGELENLATLPLAIDVTEDYNPF